MDADSLHIVALEVCAATGATIARPWALAAAAAASEGLIGVDRVGNPRHLAYVIRTLKPLTSDNDLFALVAAGVAARDAQ